MSVKEHEAWVNARHHNAVAPKAFLTRTIADGEQGTGAHGDLDRRPMTPAIADALLKLIDQSGVAGSDGRTYLLDVLRWHHGYSRAAPVASSARLKAPDAQFIRRRAHELIHDNPYLPAPVNEVMAT